MKNIILHIGRHKTGTSSLQRHLLYNANGLWQEGYYYPSTYIKGVGHHLIAEGLSLGNLRGMKRLQRETRIKETKDIVANLCEGHEKTLVLSSEAFQNADPAVIRAVFDPTEFDVKVVCYVREQASYLASAYNQKVHATWYDRLVQEFFDKEFSANYHKFGKGWSGHFEDIEFRIFDRAFLAGGSVIRDFYKNVLHLEPNQEGNEQDGNPSLTRWVLAVKRELNHRVNSGEIYVPCEHGVLFWRCAELARKDTSGPFALDEKLTREVEARFGESNRRFFRDFLGGGSFPEYRYQQDKQEDFSVTNEDLQKAFGDLIEWRAG